MRHAIEEEEKVPMEQVTNFQEVTHGGLEGGQSAYTSRLAHWLLSSACLLCTYCVVALGRRDRGHGAWSGLVRTGERGARSE